jgi:hypothetical protein
VLVDVPPKPLTSWTTIVMTCPVESANCTTATESIILRVAISNSNGAEELGPTHKFHAFNPFMYRTWAHRMKTHMLRHSHTRHQQGERSGSEREAYFIPVQNSLIRESGRAVHNVPYNEPTAQKETTWAVIHVRSPLNAGLGGGLDIVTG